MRYFSDRPLATDRVTPVAELPEAVRRLLNGEHAATRSAAPTPTGYKLRRGAKTTDYICRSSDVFAIEASCGPSECRPVQQVKLGIKEYVRGRTSKKWEITFRASPWSGSSHFAMDYRYQCGVNIKGARDETCVSRRKDAADGAASGVAVDKQKIVKAFGNTAVVTKFPMVNLLVDFADGSHATGDGS
ncbi:hypothetical protein [Streptomyces sp. NPDC005435]|uniref:hypothetical protein n=1 Tax=Streptomyces sp. NPDC005435 TaxID=3154464 RepID=UPI003453A725